MTHSLVGWALGEAGLKNKTRKGLAALILAANAPDIDVFFQWAPWEPLATHRGFAHSLIGGALILPLALWGLLLVFDRWQVRRGTEFKSGLAMRPRWLLGLCYLGALTHPLLDLQTTYSVQLFSPTSGLWYHSDSLFIIDIWLWLLLGVSIALSKEATKHGRDRSGLVVVALAFAFAYICFNLGLSDTATAAVRARAPRATAIFASPPPVAFWKRDMVWREGDRIGRAEWRMFGGLSPGEPLTPDTMRDPIVRAALTHDRRLRKFLQWSILPIARVERTDRCTARVIIADARYGLPAQNKARLYRESTVPLCGS
ncbi:MAG: metal-dependent hydrolase [Sphingomicrobium sp.]